MIEMVLVISLSPLFMHEFANNYRKLYVLHLFLRAQEEQVILVDFVLSAKKLIDLVERRC